MKRILLVIAAGVAVLLILFIAGGTLAAQLGLPTFCFSTPEGRLLALPCPVEPSRLAALSPQLPHAPASDTHPLVVDTDMAADDWMAILYLLQRPDVDVKAITVVGTGEAHCGAGMHNALALVALMGRPDIPVACGRATPLRGNRTFPESWRARVDTLLGLSLPQNTHAPYPGSATELLKQVINESQQKMHVVALGPLTNLAELLEADPSLADKLQMVTIMGGAIDVPGNVGPSSGIRNGAAEWNIYIDPHAANVVLHSGAPVTLTPLDATRGVPVTTDFYWRIARDRQTPAAEFVYRVLMQKTNDILAGGYYFWDPLAVVIVTEDQLATFRTLSIAVIEDEGPYCGRMQASADGHGIRVATAADRAVFEAIFLNTLNGRVLTRDEQDH
jgi:pyrimidine-specific ribonucleoside hydrolase